MTATTIGYEELLAEYERLKLETGDTSLKTAREFGKLWGMKSREAVRAVFQWAAENGLLVVGRKPVRRYDGVTITVPAFDFKRPIDPQAKRVLRKGKKK